MVVVAIIGLVAAMGLPSLLKALQKDGMRKAVSDVCEVCRTARSNAINHNTTVAVMIQPNERSFAAEGGAAAHSGLVSASKLPDGVDFLMVDINQQDCLLWESVRVRFYANGTSDEMTVVLHDRLQYEKLTLDFATGLVTVSDVDK